jgi:aldose 1-epimerase
MRAPSGEQFEIEFEDQRAVLVEVGGGIRTYSVAGRHVLDGYEVHEMATAGRGQVLAPWPNRLEDGWYEFHGEEHQVPLNELEGSNAIHGFVRWSPWGVQVREPHRVVLQHVMDPRPGYPFTLEMSIDYSLAKTGLTVRTTTTNIGSTAAPFGSGAHPYLTLGTDVVDDIVLRVPAFTALRSNDRGIPTGSHHVEGTELDFRSPRRIGDAKIDHGFTDLEWDASGIARVELTAGESGTGVTLWVDEAYPFVMVFTGDLPDVSRRGLAVEPMTCAPNALRSGHGLVVLEPGASTTGAWGITPHSNAQESPA